jgi:CHASE2 domain-containing sensor protein
MKNETEISCCSRWKTCLPLRLRYICSIPFREWQGLFPCVALIFLMGTLLSFFPLGDPLYRWSYDLGLLAATPVEVTNVVLVYVDDEARRSRSPAGRWAVSRGYYGELLDRLTDDKARAVVFDLAFNEVMQGEGEAEDRAFADAIRRAHGRVVLASVYEPVLGKGVGGHRMVQPAEIFANAAALADGEQQVGSAGLVEDRDGVVRRMTNSYPGSIPFAWQAVRTAELFNNPREKQKADRWFRHYRPTNTQTTVFREASFLDVISTNWNAPGYFQNKLVFVGSRSEWGPASEQRDRFQTSISSWDDRFGSVPGVYLHATAAANLARGDWIKPVGMIESFILVTLSGVLGTIVLFQLRRWTVVVTGLAMVVGIVWLGLWVENRHNLATPWLIPAFVQLPIAGVWALGRNWSRPGYPKAFISYRREDGGGVAWALHNGLRLLGFDSWLDIPQIEPGDEFPTRIDDHIRCTRSFVIVMTPGWLKQLRQAGPGPGNWIQRETKLALDYHRHVIVLCLCGVPERTKTAIPSAFAQLTSFQWETHDHHKFETNVALIGRALRHQNLLWRLFSPGGRRQ